MGSHKCQSPLQRAFWSIDVHHQADKRSHKPESVIIDFLSALLKTFCVAVPALLPRVRPPLDQDDD